MPRGLCGVGGVFSIRRSTSSSRFWSVSGMVKRSSTADKPKRLGDNFLTQFALMGMALDLWSKAELAIEIVVRDVLKISTEEVCIICGPMGAGAKVALLKSLAHHHGVRPDFVTAITAFQGIISRNSLVHGFTVYPEPSDPWLLVSREVKDKLIVRCKLLKRYLDDDVMPAFRKVMATSGLTEDDVGKYMREIVALER